jgi:hypothetical protein
MCTKTLIYATQKESRDIPSLTAKEKGNKNTKPGNGVIFNDSLFVDTFIDFSPIVQNKPVSGEF